MVKTTKIPPTSIEVNPINEIKPPTLKRFKVFEELNNNNVEQVPSKSISNMVERFVQSISNINDSGSFDTSFEVKHIQSPQRIRHRCVTELDRESLMKFVRDFEERQAATLSTSKSTPKNSPFFCRKLAAVAKKTSDIKQSSRTPCRNNAANHVCHQDVALQSHDLMPAPTAQLQRAQPERSSLRSAAKMLQFFSAKKKCKNQKSATFSAYDTAQSNNINASPVLMRAHLGCRPFTSDVEDVVEDDDDEDEQDDGISSAGSNFTQASSSCDTYSRNCSPDSSFEMHPPLVPSFKITPPAQASKSCRNPAYEFARFLRGSFHAKRASVTKLRRSISDPDHLQEMLDSGKGSTAAAPSKKTAAKPTVLIETTNIKCSDVIRSRALPANASPFRRAWGQSSFRTPRADKHTLQHPNGATQQSPLGRRTASMTASDNDVYIKSMDTYIDNLKQSRSQQQIAGDSTKSATKATNNCSFASSSAAAANAAVNFCASITTALGNNKPAVVVTSSLASTSSSSDQNEVVGPVGVAAWGTSFERLLEDPAGLHTFAEFLKKEFSAENIYFWTACERFRHLDNEAERATQAMAIFSKHLANGSPEPVNVDSQARNLTEEKLQSAEPDIFAQAQKQIFNLMKFDSYQRFIRSDLYKSCLEAEAKNLPLPYAAEDLDELLKTNFQQTASASKLKKSASNAEDRRRKSLLPWHRKTRCKSRDRAEAENGGGSNKLSSIPSFHAPSKLPLLTSSSSLKIPSTQNSMSDIHSSRSSLSSFDTLPGSTITMNSNGGQVEEMKPCSLCRVILSDGATTIVQTRPGDTVGQLVERLLEKRGLSYAYYDVVINGCNKSIDLQSPAMQMLGGKEVLIEQRVSFKLDLPDPKVISVKSKPKKQLHEVVRPILQKYNYSMDAVQVLMRDTQELLDLSLPVTVADGQRLQIVLIKAPPAPPQHSDYQNGLQSVKSANTKLSLPKSVSYPSTRTATTTSRTGSVGAAAGAVVAAAGTVNPHQSTLDEITNKVFNELLQSKVEAHLTQQQQQQQQQHGGSLTLVPADLCSLKSDDCGSENSSVFERMRRRDSNAPGMKLNQKKKSTNSQSDETISTNNTAHLSSVEPHCGTIEQIPVGGGSTAACSAKKPIIAKLKAGVRLQVTERVAENQDELLEGLKRAQLARLEDQRGTEINFELPDFLKNKENLSAANKLRKVRANLSPVSKSINMAAISTSAFEDTAQKPVSSGLERPQPAPRLSITNKINRNNASPMKIDEEDIGSEQKHNTDNNNIADVDYASSKGPPPLPPKPKVLPIKPSNWGVTNSNVNKMHSSITTASARLINNNPAVSSPTSPPALQLPSKIPIDIGRKHLGSEQTGRCAYLEEPSSSFV